MKKLRFVATLMALMTAAGLAGCSSCEDNTDDKKGDDQTTVTPPDNNPDDNKPDDNNPDDNNPDDNKDYISVAATRDELELKDYEVAGFNFARYFRISDNGSGVAAKDYVDDSEVKAEAGTYTVTCTYKEKTASYTVKVTASESVFTLSKSEVKLKTSEVNSYDFKSLFTLTVDGEIFKITDDMISSDIKAEAGEYTYAVTFFGNTKILKVTVVDENAIEIINSFAVLELTKDELADFDYTSLFSLYVGGTAEKVLAEYIDASALSSPEEGQTYSVTMRFERNGREATSTASIKVVEKTQVSIIANNIVTYPNGDNIDLKELFTVKYGNRIIEVTDDMISGTVDYSKEGDNVITLEYGGREANATVTIKLGVIIDYASSDTVIVEKGTDIGDYDFASDFVVIINGIRFTDLTASYFDKSGADFTKTGEYTVKLTVPYNTKSYGLSGVNFDYFEKEITYVVVEKKIDYSINVLSDSVVLPAGTTRYNVYSNISVTINGIKRVIYEDRDKQDITTCYAQTVSDPIDFSSSAEQIVEIDVYVLGPDADPVRVAYSLRVDNGIEVKGSERVIFSGTTVYARELFTITENGKSVTVTDDMVSGKIDLFKAGMYYVTATYKGITAQAKAVVLDSSMTGTYKTLLTDIEPYEEEEDDDYEDIGWGEYEEYSLNPDYSSSYAATAVLKDLVIDEYGDIYLGSQKAELISVIDDSTFNIRIYSDEFVFRYEDGVVTLDPDNSIKLAYHERRRPMVYFNSDIWTLESSVQINSSSSGYSVLQKNSQGNLLVSGGAYTIDLFRLKSVEDGGYYWYGMKTMLIGKYSSDTYYADEVFGFASVAPDFEQKAGFVSRVNLGGESYEFTMTNGYKATVNKAAQTVSPFAGINFKGTIDGKAATFAVAGNDRITFTVDNKRVFDLTPNDQSTLKNGGVDYGENTWLVYDSFLDSEHTPFSYRFRLDKENKTFTLDERDDLFGRYVFGKVCFFFDGYGTGEATFDTDSRYQTTAFTYKRNGANVEITYRNAQPQFEYGTSAKFLFADYKNILTVREITGIDLVGERFVNAIIYDGAIVEVNNFVLGKTSAEKELFEGLSIITKDGALTAAQMKGTIEGTRTKYVDTSLISFSRAGFYQLKINIPVGGEIKSSYYAVQILDSIYAGHKLVGRYYQSAIYSGATLNIDEFGRVTGVFGGLDFKGNATLKDNGFTATAECAMGRLTLTGEYVADGIVKVIGRGALLFTDCFTTGTVRTSGTEGCVFRAITANGNTLYLLANSVSSLGNIVEVEGNANTLGSVLKITDGNEEYFVKVSGWDGAEAGLLISDAVRGEYKLDGADDLILDGFGNVTLGGKTGTYVASGSGITALFGTEVAIYKINKTNSTYTVSDIRPDNTLFAGKSFSADYVFFCEYGEQTPYKATTVFEFKTDGKVTVKSSSAEHDEDCEDRYSPEFATASGTEGTFSVAGNKLTVTVNEKTIVFVFTDAVGLNTVTCFSTDVNSSSHGYFSPDTEFTRV